MQKFTIKQFNELYPTEDVCLEEIFKSRYGNIELCPSCSKKAKFFKVKNRKCYACEFCGHQLHPLSKTIFHKSDTSLKLWFYAIYLFANSRHGVSAKELERQLGVTYKCAWRIAKQIRLLFSQNKDVLSGIVEMDEAYVGGRGRRQEIDKKTPVVGAVERKGKVNAAVMPEVYRRTIYDFIEENFSDNTHIMSDDSTLYRDLRKLGYNHSIINHKKEKYVKGIIHTQTIEGFWSLIKRSIKGTHIHVSRKYLQNYLDEFIWKYNNRNGSTAYFSLLLNRVVSQVQ